MQINTRIISIFFFLILISISPASVGAQTTDEVFVRETGHDIRGEFFKFYFAADDPLLLFGYPITDEIPDPITGEKVQYFQRARFDLTYSQNGLSVQLAPLGTLLYEAGAPLAPVSTNSPTCRLFPSTSKSVCYAFLQFYDAHNGAFYFGNPITELLEEGGRFVQYFDRARLEWRPEMPAGQRVVISDLGRIYYSKRVDDLNLLGPAGYNLINPPDPIQAYAFVSETLVIPGEKQTLFVIVQDADFNPIANAFTSMTLIFPDGSQRTTRLKPTDSDGITLYQFTVSKSSVNDIVRIEIQAEYGGLSTKAFSWFRVWW